MNRTTISTVIFMMISPLVGLYSSLKNYSFKSKSYLRSAILIFAVLYGSSFSMNAKIGDGVRHWQNVYDYYTDLSFEQFVLDSRDILQFKANRYIQEDLYIHTLSYFLGSVVALPGLFFTIVALVYGYFFSGSVVRVFTYFPSLRRHFPVFVLAVLFIALLNLQSMNTVRTWTGFWMLFYGAISFLQTRKKKYLLLLLLPPFVHVGYFIMIIPVWMAIIFRFPKTILFGVYLASFAFTFVQPSTAIQELNKLEVGQEKVSAYETEEQATIEDRFQQYAATRWYKQYQKSGIVSWCVVAISVLLFLQGIYLQKMNTTEVKLFEIGILFKILSNSSWFLFALGNRTDVIFLHFVLASVLLFWQRQYELGDQKILNGLNALPYKMLALGILPLFIYTISEQLQYMSVYLLLFVPLSWLGDSTQLSLRELIGFFI